MTNNESNLLALIVIFVIFTIALCTGEEVNEKQEQINDLINKHHQQIELIDALQQSR